MVTKLSKSVIGSLHASRCPLGLSILPVCHTSVACIQKVLNFCILNRIISCHQWSTPNLLPSMIALQDLPTVYMGFHPPGFGVGCFIDRLPSHGCKLYTYLSLQAAFQRISHPSTLFHNAFTRKLLFNAFLDIRPHQKPFLLLKWAKPVQKCIFYFHTLLAEPL